MKRIWFTADTHFSSDDTIIRENRPFVNSEEFDKFVINIWNKQVLSKDNIIYHLGDFITYTESFKDYWEDGLDKVKEINGKVILIIGNNEELLIKEVFNDSFSDFRDYCLKLGFFDVKKDCFLDLRDLRFYLNHYPHNYQDTYINLFAHTHRVNGLYKSFGINVCCDLNYFRLFSEEEIFRLLKNKELYWDGDADVNIY